jgi:outer membrane protein assembly factor BamB
MHRDVLILNFLVAVAAGCVAGDAMAAAGDVLTQAYNHYRTGAQLEEHILNIANVRPATFGKVASLPVDGYVHAQPLAVNALAMDGKAGIDVIYVATGNNSVFAFDVTDSRNQLLWKRSLASERAHGGGSTVGIVGTPVIDRESATLFVVTGSIEDGKGRFRVHALDLRDGRDKAGGPVLIDGSVQIDDEEVSFHPTDRRIAVQRAALALANGKLIVAFGGDFFEGWVFAYDAHDLRRPSAAFCTTCVSRIQSVSRVDYLSAKCTFLGPAGGIWQSGRGPVVDDRGMVYFFTGNKAHIIRQGCPIPEGNNACAQCSLPGGCSCGGVGQEKVCRGPDTCIANESRNHRSFDTNEALVKLDPDQALKIAGWFRPANWNAKGMHGLEFNDLDLGGSGPLLIPGTSRLIGGGKEGVLYLLDADLRQDHPLPVQSFAIAPAPSPPLQYYRHILGGPILWSRPADVNGSRLFVWRLNDSLRSYRVTDHFEDCDRQDVQPTGTEHCRSIAASRERIDHHPGGILALSANGEDPQSAVVWAYTSSVGNGPGKLMAFGAVPDAVAPDRLQEIWDSETCAGDAIEIGSTFAPPTISNGRVYVATGADRVDVFGLVAERPCVMAPQPEGAEHLQSF